MSTLDVILRAAVQRNIVDVTDAETFSRDTDAKAFLDDLVAGLIETGDIPAEQYVGSDYWAEVLRDTLKDEGILLYDETKHRYNVSFVTDDAVHIVTVDTFLNESENEAIIELAQENVPPVILEGLISTDVQEA